MLRKFWLIYLIVLAFTGCWKDSKESPVNETRTVGGNCHYESYPGIIIIKQIKPRTLSNVKNVSPDSEKMFVEYEFTVDKNVSAPPQVTHINNTIELTKLQIEQRNVKVGGKFQASASYQTSGTCSPGPYVEDFEKWK